MENLLICSYFLLAIIGYTSIYYLGHFIFSLDFELFNCICLAFLLFFAIYRAICGAPSFPFRNTDRYFTTHTTTHWYNIYLKNHDKKFIAPFFENRHLNAISYALLEMNWHGNQIKNLKISSQDEIEISDDCLKHLKHFYFDTIDVSELNMWDKSELYKSLSYACKHLFIKDESYHFYFGKDFKPDVYKNMADKHNRYFIYDWDKNDYIEVTQEEFEEEKFEWLLKRNKSI